MKPGMRCLISLVTKGWRSPTGGGKEMLSVWMGATPQLRTLPFSSPRTAQSLQPLQDLPGPPRGGQKKMLNFYLPNLGHVGTVIFSETAAQRHAVSFPRKRPTCRSASQRAEPGEDKLSARRKGRTLP